MTETAAQITRIYNNNVVLAVVGGQTQVLLGRGIGYGRKSGDFVDESLIEHRFVSQAPTRVDRDALLLADAPFDLVQAVRRIVAAAHERLRVRASDALLLALVDHFMFAIRRGQEGIAVDFPLTWEVKQLYPEEYAFAKESVVKLTETLSVTMPKDEAVAITLHFVNAQLANPDMSRVVRNTEVIQRVVDLIGARWGRPLDPEAMGTARFVTHLRYLFARVQSGQEVSSPPGVVEAIRQQLANVLELADALQSFLERELNRKLSLAENAYLALHLERLRLEQAQTSN